MTCLPVKNIQQLAAAVLEIEFDAWREVNGIRVPGRLHLTTDTGYEATENITEIRHDDSFDESLFARPPHGPADYRFAAGVGPARVPMKADDGRVFIQARLNESAPVWLAFRTGASGNVLDSDFGNSLLTHGDGVTGPAGASDEATRANFTGVRIGLTGLELHDQTFESIPLGFLPPVDGKPVI